MISGAIGDLMKAEFTGLRNRDGLPMLPQEGATIEDWQMQTFLSSGSLIAKSCQSALLLAGHTEELKQAAHRFGCHVAYAHQVCFGVHFSCLRHERAQFCHDFESHPILGSFRVFFFFFSIHLSQAGKDV
jgi:hypothetical protein